MSQSKQTSSPAPAAAASVAQRPFRILLVDQDQRVRQVMHDAVEAEHLQVLEADSIAAARQQLTAQPVDLLLVDTHLPDGSGMDLAGEMRRSHPATQTIVLTGQPSLERAIEAIRVGVADYIVKPLDLAQLNDSVKLAMARCHARRRNRRRYARLRKICGQLNKAHQEVSKQVDVLCNDLVTAYQELAQQMQQVVQTSEFSTYVGQELDLERLLRKTLEFLLQKAGPTNAALFLPATADEYTVGGYVNYDCTREPADMILQHLADVAAPKLAQRGELLHITDNTALAHWLGDDAAYLADAHVVAFSCRHEGETLAAIVLFRDAGEPYSQDLVDTAAAIGPVLGEYLARIIRIHHRHIPGLNGHDDDRDHGETCGDGALGF